MIYLILLFTILFFILAWRRLDIAAMFLIVALPAYLIRFNIFGLPATLLEIMIWVIFLAWFLKSYRYIYENCKLKIRHLLKIACPRTGENCKLKIIGRYPFDWEMVLLLLVALTAVAVAGFSASAFGIFKAYFFEPVLFFIVVLNVMKGEPGREKILGSLAVSALMVSALAIYQKITGQLIDNSAWAALETRRAVSFFGYPNAVGLYLGPIILVMIGWRFSIFTYARRDKIKNIFISLTVVASSTSIYFAKSKGALLGVAAGLVVFGLMASKKIRWMTVAIIMLASIATAAYQPAKNLVMQNITFTNLSGQIRKAGWSDTWRMLNGGRLITGAGLANYQAIVAPYHTEGIFFKEPNDPGAQRKLVFNESYRAAHWQPLEIYLYPHNLILNFWSELGLAGLILFIWIILKYFWLGAKNFKAQKNKYMAAGLIGAMVVVVTHGLVDVPYFKNDLAILFWLLIAMMGMINLENNYGKNL